MGQTCCSICISAYHGIDITEYISIQLKDMIYKISWEKTLYDRLFITLEDETKKKIALTISKHVKEKKIIVSNLNGFVTNYIAINIAGFIFHKFITDKSSYAPPCILQTIHMTYFVTIVGRNGNFFDRQSFLNKLNNDISIKVKSFRIQMKRNLIKRSNCS